VRAFPASARARRGLLAVTEKSNGGPHGIVKAATAGKFAAGDLGGP